MIKKLITLLRQGAIGTLILAIAFVALEPAMIYATGTAASQFTISQTVTSEISFVTAASNVIMTGSLGGISGGTALGYTTVAVRTNSLLGYNMTMMASTTSGSVPQGSMTGTASSSNYIGPYIPISNPGTPEFTFNNATNTSEFGYTVNASTTSDVAPLFRNNSSVCNSGASTSLTNCWLAATNTPVTIISRNIPTPSTGATTTLAFEVKIGANPSPMIPNDTYVATTTLTATTNP
jgi:hypothetical protein